MPFGVPLDDEVRELGFFGAPVSTTWKNYEGLAIEVFLSFPWRGEVLEMEQRFVWTTPRTYHAKRLPGQVLCIATLSIRLQTSRNLDNLTTQTISKLLNSVVKGISARYHTVMCMNQHLLQLIRSSSSLTQPHDSFIAHGSPIQGGAFGASYRYLLYIYNYLYIIVKDIPVGLFCNPICQVSQTERF